MVLLYTNHDGSTVEINEHTSSVDMSTSEQVSQDGVVCRDTTPSQKDYRLSATKPKGPSIHNSGRSISCRVSSPLFCMTSSEDTSPPAVTVAQASEKSQAPTAPQSLEFSPQPMDEKDNPKRRQLVYNEYGELVDVEEELHVVDSSNITALQALRLIRKNFHHEFKKKMRTIIAPVSASITRSNTKTEQELPKITPLPSPQRYINWQLATPMPLEPNTTPGVSQYNIPIYCGPLRVLEIGCDDGIWCWYAKKKKPEWIIEGIDDVDHWSATSGDEKIRDFMEPIKAGHPEGYFDQVHLHQSKPEFTVRNLNHLTKNPKPIPHNLYGMVRGRHIFDRIESYKCFLEEVRLILQPDGVVEFLELDPRPRVSFLSRRHSDVEHRSKSENDWTDVIADRFRDPSDAELATYMPSFMKRVEERLSASLRPKDGVAAVNLKSWLQGAGFCNVKQTVVRLPIGGPSQAGKALLNLLEWQGALEDSIPILKSTLPKVDYEKLNYANLYVNFHVVTANKPRFLRAGDMLKDGKRLEMSPQRELAMNRQNDAKSNQWQRFNLDEKLSDMLESLITLDASRSNLVDLNTLGPPEGAERKYHKKSVSVSSF